MTRKSFKHDFEIEKPIELVFPLFTAEGEKLWAPGWDYRQIFGEKNVKEDDIFVTQTHDHSAADAIWIVKKYDAQNYFVQYYKIEPTEKVGLITVQCENVSNEKTRISVAYSYTALSNSGEKFVSRFTETEYASFINEWKFLIDEYFSKHKS